MNPPPKPEFPALPGVGSGPDSRGGGWGRLSDGELALAAGVAGRAGKEAFVEIVRRHQTAVCAVAWSVTGRAALLDDVAQETFLKAWRRLPTLRDPAKLRAWLTRIAHDCAVDALQREKPHLSLDEPLPEPLPVCAAAAPDKAAAEAEEEALVWSALAALPENLRTPLVLFYREGQSVAAVAAALDLSEEAVRQRLTRGRQALRAAVESRIETVLGRIQPSALLIVTVAAGIGLLTKPAALAAGAIAGLGSAGASAAASSTGAAAGASSTSAAASASTAATAATGTTASTTATAATTAAASFSTIMTATTWLAAAVTLAAFLPVGWKTGGSGSPADSGQDPSPLSAAAAGPADPFAAFPNSKLLAEWRRLHQVHGTDAAAMPAIYTAIQSESDGFHRDSLNLALMAEWAAVDPEGAFRELWSEKKNQDHAAMMVREWLKRAPAQAAARLAASLSGAEILVAVLMPDVATLAPDQFPALLSSLPEAKAGKYPSQELPAQLTEAYQIFARSHPDAAMDALALLKGDIRDRSQAIVASQMASKDPAAAMKWASAIDAETGRYLAVMAVSRIWAVTDPAAALSHFPPNFETDGPARILGIVARNDLATGLRLWKEMADKFSPMARPAVSQAVGEWLGKDPQATLQLLSGEPSALTDQYFKADPYAAQGLYGGLGTVQRDVMWKWITREKLEGMSGKVAGALMNAEFHSDPAAAIRRFTAMPEEWQAKLSVLPDHRRNLTETLTLTQCTELLQAAAPAARPQLLAAFFGKTDAGMEPDIPYWRSQVDNLPKESRETTINTFTKDLARTDPLQALDFAQSLPEGSLRQAAFTRLADLWTAADTHAASAWVAGLPPGGERDAAAAGLVKSLPIGDTEAALTWAGTIADPGLRLRSLQNFLQAAQWSDPDKIPALLQNPLINADDREALRRNPLGK